MVQKIDVTQQPAYVHHHYEKDQQGDCWISPVEGGFSARIKFVNNKPLDGDHYSCDVVLRDDQGKVTGAAQYKAGVNARGFGGVNERETTLHMPMTPEEKASTKIAEVEFGKFDKVNDSILWKTVIDFAKKVVEIFVAPKIVPHEADPIQRFPGQK